jgi:hypothetical protein
MVVIGRPQARCYRWDARCAVPGRDEGRAVGLEQERWAFGDAAGRQCVPVQELRGDPATAEEYVVWRGCGAPPPGSEMSSDNVLSPARLETVTRVFTRTASTPSRSRP